MKFEQFENIVMGSEDIAQVLKVSPGYIQQLVREKDFPKETHNQYCVIDFIQKYISYQEECHKKEIKKIRNEMSEAKPRFDMAAARLKELELEEKEGRLISISDVEKFSSNRATVYTKSLDALATKLPPLLKDCPIEVMYQVIRKETDFLREQVAALPYNVDWNTFEFK